MCQNCGWGCVACCTTASNVLAVIFFIWGLLGLTWIVSFNVTVGLAKLEVYSYEVRNTGGSSTSDTDDSDDSTSTGYTTFSTSSGSSTATSSGSSSGSSSSSRSTSGRSTSGGNNNNNNNHYYFKKGSYAFDSAYCKANADRKKLCDLFKSAGSGTMAVVALAFICVIFSFILTIIFILPEASCSCLPVLKPGGNITTIIAGALEFAAMFLASVGLIIYSRKTSEIRKINPFFVYFWNYYFTIVGVIVIGIAAILHISLGTCATGTRSMNSSQYGGARPNQNHNPSNAAAANDKL